jgi:hypothetical protein
MLVTLAYLLLCELSPTFPVATYLNVTVLHMLSATTAVIPYEIKAG